MFTNPTVQDFINREIGGPTPISRPPPQAIGSRTALARALLGDITPPRAPPPLAAPQIRGGRGLEPSLPSEGVMRPSGSQNPTPLNAISGQGNTGASGLASGIGKLGTGIDTAIGQYAAKRAAQQTAIANASGLPGSPVFGVPASPTFGSTPSAGASLPSFTQQPGVSAGTPSTSPGAGVGGSRSWRNNNPGNIEYGGFASAHGAVGSDGRFAIFPSEQAGIDAQRALLFNSSGYSNLTLPQAISKWAPGSENNVPAYVAAMGGDTSGKKMSDYSPAEQDALLNSMRVHEGWRPGTATMPAAGSAADIAQDRQQDAADTSSAPTTPPPSPSGLGGPQSTGTYNGQPYTYQTQPALGPQGMLQPPTGMTPLAAALAGQGDPTQPPPLAPGVVSALDNPFLLGAGQFGYG